MIDRSLKWAIGAILVARKAAGSKVGDSPHALLFKLDDEVYNDDVEDYDDDVEMWDWEQLRMYFRV